MKALGLGFLLAAAACGGDDGELPVLEGTDPGTGSQTLAVSGSVDATEEINNASDPNNFSASFEVRVTRDGAAVEGGEVRVTSAGGTVELAHEGNGVYLGAQVGYHRSYRLDIDAGGDFVEGAVVIGPDLHAFLAPEAGETVAGGEDLLIEWSREEEAESARLETRSMEERSVTDSGSYLVAQGELDEEEERVRLWRANQVNLEGATSGTFSVEVRNQLEFFVVR